MCVKLSLSLKKQLVCSDSKRQGDPMNVVKTDISLASFYAADVGAIKIGEMC